MANIKMAMGLGQALASVIQALDHGFALLTQVPPSPPPMPFFKAGAS